MGFLFKEIGGVPTLSRNPKTNRPFGDDVASYSMWLLARNVSNEDELLIHTVGGKL